MAKNMALSGGTQFFGAGRAAEPKASLLARGTNWFNALRAARNDSQIERFINDHGGTLTDSLEREITQRFANADPGRY